MQFALILRSQLGPSLIPKPPHGHAEPGEASGPGGILFTESGRSNAAGLGVTNTEGADM